MKRRSRDFSASGSQHCRTPILWPTERPAIATGALLQLEGFRNRQLRPLLAQMLGLEENNISPGRVSYELRRLRLHGLIERIEGTHRYHLTAQGLRTVLFYQRTYARVIRPGPLYNPHRLLWTGPASDSRIP
jgi:hypothetical protein